MPIFRYTLLLIAGAMIAIVPLAAQNTSQSSPAEEKEAATQSSANAPEVTAREQAPTFKVNVRLVIVRAVVRDAQGRAIGDLRKDDFEVLDNGKPQVISRFSVEKSATANAAAATSASLPPTGSEKPVTPLVAPDRYIAYVFDDVHLKPQDLMPARNAASRQLEALQPADRAGIFTISGQGNQDFTADKAKLRAAMGHIQPHPIAVTDVSQCPYMNYYFADQIINKNDSHAMEVATADALACAFQNDPRFRVEAQTLASSAASQALNMGDSETRLTLDALNEVAQRISVMPGQRVIVLASPGFYAPDQQYAIDDLVDRALRANTIISTLDARGLYTVPVAGDVTRSTSISGTVAAMETEYQVQSLLADSDVLATIADSTGGIYFHNNNDLDSGFRRAAAAPEFYYVLGFSPQNLKLDGSFHSLRVRLKPAGLTVEARKGYYAPRRAPDAEEEARREIEEALFSREESHDLPIELETQFFKASPDDAKLSVLARLDPRQLRYRKVGGRNHGEMTVVSALFDSNGKFIGAVQKQLTMNWKDETLAGKLQKGMTLKSSFDVKPGNYLVRLVVRDSGGELAAENGTVEIP